MTVTYELRGKLQMLAARQYPEMQKHLQWCLGQPLTMEQGKIVLQHQTDLLEDALKVFFEAIQTRAVTEHAMADLFERVK